MLPIAALVYLPLASLMLGTAMLATTLALPPGSALQAAGPAYLAAGLTSLALAAPLAFRIARRMTTWRDRLGIPADFDVRRRKGMVVFIRR
ncbi:hypothetical protein SAMN02745194_04165 [Roseomonas rosea]|uniref:Uncharacterized protein n=1 Tax=Muricoccus roseus TaxID=198092 RepID=A0A1M6PNT1_9PROT|nr:hypothetical protein [Roseomonas rosea]SHK09557.1 hypothetical protein SAMN02745194_04165 [Roseomonas rosea]